MEGGAPTQPPTGNVSPDLKYPPAPSSDLHAQLAKLEEGNVTESETSCDEDSEGSIPIVRKGELYRKFRAPGCKGYLLSLVDVSVQSSWEKLLRKSERDQFVFYDFMEGEGWFSKYFPPVIARQFYAKDTLFLERKFRKVTWDELFIDLVFVAVVRQGAFIIAHDDFAVTSIQQFLLVFPAIHHTWIMIHQLINAFNFDFILWRIYLVLMIIMVYGMGLNGFNAFDFISEGSENTTNLFLICYLIFRSLYMAYYLMASIYMMKFRPFIFTQLGIKFIGMILMFAAIFVANSGNKLALYVAGYAWDFFGYDLIFPLIKKVLKWKELAYRITINVEHNTERMGNFTLVMLGEMVIALLWGSSDTSLNLAYVSTIMGLLIVVCFQSFVFSLDIAHMLRQSVYATMGVHALTLCFHVCLVACSSALDVLTFRSAGLDPEYYTKTINPEEPVEFNPRWIFCTGAAAALIFQTCKTIMEHNEPLAWAKRYVDRLIVRQIAAGCIFVVAGWGSHLRPVDLISTVSGILLSALVVDGSLAWLLHREHETQEREYLDSIARGKVFGDGSSIVSQGAGIIEG